MPWDNPSAGAVPTDSWGVSKTESTDQQWGQVPVPSGERSDTQGNNDSVHENPSTPYKACCRKCGINGHFTKDCHEGDDNIPGRDDSVLQGRNREDMVCFNCQGTGHSSKYCEKVRRERVSKPLIDFSMRPVMSSDEAWSLLMAADKSKDMDDIKDAFETYCRNTEEATFQSIETKLRFQHANLRLVCFQKELPLNKTNVDLQGNRDKTYVVGFQLKARSSRTKMNAGLLPQTAEENFEWLGDCGFTVHSPIPVCFQCNEKGHTRADCPQGEITADQRDLSHVVKIVCPNCDQEGHRLRTCPEPRKVRSTGCRNCGSEDHKVVECDQPRKPKDGDLCYNCESPDHYGKDCPEERKPREDTRECYNCGQGGHIGRDCPEERKPRADTRDCHNCGQSGHISRDCPEPRRPKVPREAAGLVPAIDYPTESETLDSFGATPSWIPQPSWQTKATAPTVAASGW